MFAPSSLNRLQSARRAKARSSPSLSARLNCLCARVVDRARFVGVCVTTTNDRRWVQPVIGDAEADGVAVGSGETDGASLGAVVVGTVVVQSRPVAQGVEVVAHDGEEVAGVVAGQTLEGVEGGGPHVGLVGQGLGKTRAGQGLGEDGGRAFGADLRGELVQALWAGRGVGGQAVDTDLLEAVTLRQMSEGGMVDDDGATRAGAQARAELGVQGRQVGTQGPGPLPVLGAARGVDPAQCVSGGGGDAGEQVGVQPDVRVGREVTVSSSPSACSACSSAVSPSWS